MQTIATKLTAVRSIKQAEGWTEQELRSLIHGCGGSPRRAKRMLRADQAVAKMLSEAYSNAIAEGTHHVHATKACNELYLTLVPAKATEASEAGEGEPESDEEPEAEPATPKVIRRRRAVQPTSDDLKALL